jgi:hypothetical protein
MLRPKFRLSAMIGGEMVDVGQRVRKSHKCPVRAVVWYQHPPRVGKEKQERVAAAPRAVREIASKAQCRLSARYRALTRKGKLKTVAVTAVARELSAFIWAINRQIANPGAAAR